MKKTYLFAMTLILAGTLFAGCASVGETQAASSDSQTVSEETKEEGNTIEVYNGTMPIPESYDNFIVLKNTLVEHFAALDVMPKAVEMAALPTEESDSYAAKYYYDGPARVFANGELEELEILPTDMKADLEEILALEPDFIVASDAYEQYLEKLEAIAPTYLIPSSFDTENGEDAWKQQHRLIGTLLGKEEEAEANISAYETLAEQYQKDTSDLTEGKTALIVQLNAKGFKVRMEKDQPQLYKELGFSFPEGLGEDYESTDVSVDSGSFPIEAIAPFDPDYLFIDVQSEADYETLKDTPIWKNLTAVKNGNVMEISHFVWVQSTGPLSKTIQLQDAADFVLEGKAVTSDPILQ